MEKITITKPDDWHLHLRDDAYMASVVIHTAQFYKRALVMPNLSIPVSNLILARQYRDRILKALPEDVSFEPLMTLYLTSETTVEEIQEAKQSGLVKAIKLYPAGATTNSSNGVHNLDQCDAVFNAMQEIGIPLAVHGEVTDPTVDIFDRERVFVENDLQTLAKRYPQLKIILEHVTTREGVQFVEESSTNIAATITPHHMLLNRNQMLAGGINPHLFCFPIIKSEMDRKEVLKAATSGNPKFFLGTDSAPHSKRDKESAHGKAGVFNAPVSLLIYTEMFESEGKLENLEGFASVNGASFYGLPQNSEKITLEKGETAVPKNYDFGDQQVVPLKAGNTIGWRLAK